MTRDDLINALLGASQYSLDELMRMSDYALMDAYKQRYYTLEDWENE